MAATNNTVVSELLYRLWSNASATDRAELLKRIHTTEEQHKEALRNHYATGRPQRFHQLDGFRDIAPGDDDMVPDENGDVLMRGCRWELRHSGPELAVPLFVHANTSHSDAVRLLSKLLAWLKDDPEFLKPGGWLLPDGVVFSTTDTDLPF